MKLKNIIIAIAAMCSPIVAAADDYVVVLTDSKVFDAPVAKDEYASKNENDEDVVITAGMAFKVAEKKTGWDVVEYSPGLRGMIMQTIEAAAKNLETPAAGNFNVANNAKESVNVSKNNNVWTLASGSKKYSGRLFGNVVIFFDAEVNPAYSLVVLNGKPVVYNYSNTLTKFF